MPGSRFDGLVLDMDGVIVDTPALHRRVWEEFVQSAPWPELRERPAGSAGRRSKDVLTELLGDRLSHEEIERIVDGLHARFLRLAEDIDTVFPAMRALVEGLAGRVRVAIGTSAPRRVVESLLGSLLDSVDATITSDECDAGKPNPEVYERAQRALGLDGRRVLVVEDTAIGVGAGVAAGCEVWAIATTPDVASACLAAGASVIARDAAAMAALVTDRLAETVGLGV